MPILTLLRHAKSDWDDPVKRDFDRPLNGRGRKAAAIVGAYIRDQKIAFDHVYASPALRVRETIEGVESGLGLPMAVNYDQRIYMASGDELLDMVRETPDTVGHLLLIGHNPGLEDLLLTLTEGRPSMLRSEAETKYPTAALATLEFDNQRWAEIGEGSASIVRFMRPRDLDPTLGPDN